MSDEACRADVWLWRARFFKTRSLAAKFLDEGKVRLTRGGAETRIDKCARPVKVGDRLVFALGGRLVAVVVEAQLRRDQDKRWTWPVYLATLRARLRSACMLRRTGRAAACRWRGRYEDGRSCGSCVGEGDGPSTLAERPRHAHRHGMAPCLSAGHSSGISGSTSRASCSSDSCQPR